MLHDIFSPRNQYRPALTLRKRLLLWPVSVLIAVSLVPAGAAQESSGGHEQGGSSGGHETGSEHSGDSGKGGTKAHGRRSGVERRPPTHGHVSGVHENAETGEFTSNRGYRGGFDTGLSAQGVPSPVEGHDHDEAGASGTRGRSAGSGRGLARLNVARSLAPHGSEEGGHDEGDTGDSDEHEGGDEQSPRYYLSLYRTELLKAGTDPVAAGTYLGKAANQTITPDVVATVNSILGVEMNSATLAQVAEAAETERLSNPHGGGESPDDPGKPGDSGKPEDPGSIDQEGLRRGSDASVRIGHGDTRAERNCADIAGRKLKSTERMTGRNLSRLDTASTFLWPGRPIDRARSTPVYVLAGLQEELSKPTPDLNVAGTYLGLISTRPVDPRLVLAVGDFLCVSVNSSQAAQIATIAEAQRLQSAPEGAENKKAPKD